jgi:hypothetical protein
MNLAERYATELGLKLGNQSLLETFYPLPFSRYIVLHAGGGMAAKVYPYYHMVIEMIRPYLDAADIRVVQIGDGKEAGLPGCHHLQGKTNLHQSSFLVHNAMLLLGNDSCWGHRAGYLGIPIVQPWGPTDPKNHSSYDADPSKTAHIRSHRWGRNPTFAAQENPSSIALVPPEDLATAVLKLLAISHPSFPRTQYMGILHQHIIFDWIPNSAPTPNLNPDVPITVRMDLVHAEQNLVALLQSGRKVTILTNKPINLGILSQFRQSILSYSHCIDMDCQLSYVSQVRTLLSNVGWFTRESDPGKLSALRFHFFDVCAIESVPYLTKADYLKESASYLNKPLDTLSISDRLYLKTNKLIMSKSKLYLTYAHEAADIPTPSLDAREVAVIDNDLLWREATHYHIYLKD